MAEGAGNRTITLERLSGLANARVSLTDSNGIARIASTNSLGYYRFDGVAVGQNVVATVTAKGHRFDSRVVTVADAIPDLDFVAQ